MKRLAVLFLLLFPLTVCAADLVPLNYVFPVYGSVTDNTFKSTLDNTAKSVRTLAEAAGVTWYQDGRPPQGMTYSVETNDARMGTGTISAANGIGHIILKDNLPSHISGAAYISNLYFTNKSASDNAVLQITLER